MEFKTEVRCGCSLRVNKERGDGKCSDSAKIKNKTKQKKGMNKRESVKTKGWGTHDQTDI